MENIKPKYNTAEFARKGQAVYKREVLPHMTDQDEGKFVAIDIETGAYEIHEDDYTGTERLLDSHPKAQIWLCRVGQEAAYRMTTKSDTNPKVEEILVNLIRQKSISKRLDNCCR